jgi:hypothetical protein
MSHLLNIFALIEQAAAGASQALQPSEPGIAQDVALGALLLSIVTQLMPHAKAAVQTAANKPQA